MQPFSRQSSEQYNSTILQNFQILPFEEQLFNPIWIFIYDTDQAQIYSAKGRYIANLHDCDVFFQCPRTQHENFIP
jgi:hypothetical protein